MIPSEFTGSTATLAAAEPKPKAEGATKSKSEPQDSEAAVDSMVGSMVKHLAAAKDTTVDEEECEDKAEEDDMQGVQDDAAEEAENPERLGRGRTKGAKAKPKAFKGSKATPKGKAKGKAKAKAKAAPSATLPSRSAMRFVDTKFHAPRHYGQCTVYTDMNKRSWRLKLNPGDRHEKYYIWGKNPLSVWNRMIAAILEQHRAH